MGKHRKHAKLKLRDNDQYAPNEVAILGANCSVISELVNDISNRLNGYQLAYFDASHSKEMEAPSITEYTFHHKGHVAVSGRGSVNKFNQRIQFSQYDYVFINGNHYRGAKQILILDPEKEASVLKRLEQLDNVQFVVKLDTSSAYFDFLLEAYPQIENLLCYSIDEIDKISKHIENLIKEKIAPVRGLVLAGGKSVRMGSDKGLLQFHGKDQRSYAADLMKKNNMQTFLSVRPGQIVEGEEIIEDTFLGLGPFGAICSAFQKHPDVAWFVIATDLPFVNDDLIAEILRKRNPSKAATAIKGTDKEFPEPLITIWEPKSYPLLLNYLGQGYSCPRKVLINSDIEIIEVDDNLIRNINTPEEFKQAFKELND